MLGTAAFGMWGLFPLYWPLLEPTSAIEILAHRIVWSLIVSSGLLLASRRAGRLRGIWAERRIRVAMTVAGVVICFNWGTYIWGVNNGHVVETSLGYYINPLVTVLMGVVFLSSDSDGGSGRHSASPLSRWSCSASRSADRRGSR